MNALLQCMFSLWCSAQQKYDFFRYRFCERRRSDTPVCEHSKGAVSLDDAPHHADLLRSEQLQRQSLAGDQHHSRVWKHRDGLAAVVIMDCAPVKLLHVWAQVLRDTARTASTHAGSQWHDESRGRGLLQHGTWEGWGQRWWRWACLPRHCLGPRSPYHLLPPRHCYLSGHSELMTHRQPL